MMPDIQELAREIKSIHQTRSQNRALLIEKYLDEKFSSCTIEQRLEYLAAVKTLCITENTFSLQAAPTGDDIMLQFCRLLLGKTFSAEDLASSDVPERLSQELNTVFDALNQLVLLIDTTFSSENGMQETIRHIISSDLGSDPGSRMAGDTPSRSLEEYLNQIRVAFLTSHQAFKDAAHDLTDKILYELDPRRMAKRKSKSFKIGSLHKAEKFEKYEQTYTNCKKWFDSGRFMEEFLRKFEKNCQKLSCQQRR